MTEFSPQRVTRLTLILGALGTVAVLAKYGSRDAAGFFLGSILSLLSFRSWERLAETVGASGQRPATGSAMFLALRYVLIGAILYATMKYLGSTPAAMIVGLFVSFAAVALELLFGAVVSK